MLLASDVARRTVLRMGDLGSLFVDDYPVGLRLVFHIVDPILLMIQPGGLPLIQGDISTVEDLEGKSRRAARRGRHRYRLLKTISP